MQVQKHLMLPQRFTQSRPYPVTDAIGQTYNTICTRTARDATTATSISAYAATASDEAVCTGSDSALPRSSNLRRTSPTYIQPYANRRMCYAPTNIENPRRLPIERSMTRGGRRRATIRPRDWKTAYSAIYARRWPTTVTGNATSATTENGASATAASIRGDAVRILCFLSVAFPPAITITMLLVPRPQQTPRTQPRLPQPPPPLSPRPHSPSTVTKPTTSSPSPPNATSARTPSRPPHHASTVPTATTATTTSAQTAT